MRKIKLPVICFLLCLAALALLADMPAARAAALERPSVVTLTPALPRSQGTGLRLSTRNAEVVKTVIRRAPWMMSGHKNESSSTGSTQSAPRLGLPAAAVALFIVLLAAAVRRLRRRE